MKHDPIKRADPRLLQDALYETINVKPKRPLRAPGEWTNEGFYVRDGILAVFRPRASGGRQIVAVYYADELVQPRPGNYGIEALVESRVSVLKNLSGQPVPLVERFAAASRDAAIAHEWLAVSSLDCSARVAHLLMEHAERSGFPYSAADWMHLPFTQQTIAEITGMTSVNVNRVMANLERQGLIERKGRELRFKQADELRRMASFNERYLAA